MNQMNASPVRLPVGSFFSLCFVCYLFTCVYHDVFKLLFSLGLLQYLFVVAPFYFSRVCCLFNCYCSYCESLSFMFMLFYFILSLYHFCTLIIRLITLKL